MQLLSAEKIYGRQIFLIDLAAMQFFQVSEGFLLSFQQQSGQQLLETHREVQHAFGGDIVDIFQEDDIAVQGVQILQQGAVASRTEAKPAVVVT